MNSYPDIQSFYAARGGALSGECDFGVQWRDQVAWPHYRVSVVHDTGDIYAIKLAGDGSIELLGTLVHDCELAPGSLSHADDCAYTLAETAFAGWPEANELDWLRERI